MHYVHNTIRKISKQNNICGKQIKIYEMFMRDGLQSLNKVYSLETKTEFIKILNQCNFHCIEFGSTTSPKLLPQMANSYELYTNIKKNSNTKYTMLVPGITQIPKVIDSGINSFGIVCSISEKFAQKNLKKTSKETLENVIQQMNLITKINDQHIRVYLSCSFGSPWENFDINHIDMLKNYINTILEYAKNKNISSDNLDIVISDTVGLSTETRTNEILKMINTNMELRDINYLGMHIHSKGNNFTKIVNSCLNNNIYKYDSSMLGIGGCPFAEDNALGNISTLKLISFLKSLGYCKEYNLQKLKYAEESLDKLLKE